MGKAASVQHQKARSIPDDRAGWDHFPHGADIGVHGWGTELARAFEQAALALTAIVVNPTSIRQEESVHITCEAATLESLLVERLNAVIYEMAARQMVFGRYTVAIRDHRLTARASGEPLDPERHEPAVEPKGATYTTLHVAQRADGIWDAQCVVDV